MLIEELDVWDEEEGSDHPSRSDVMFDSWRTLRGGVLAELCVAIIADVLADLATPTNSGHIRADLRANVEAIVTSIIANLIVTHRGWNKGGKLVVSRRHDAVSTYDRKGFRKLPGAIDSMKAQGLIKVFPYQRERKRTTVQATGELLAALNDPAVTLADVVQAPGEQRLVLTSRPAVRWLKGRRQANVPVKYAETAETKALTGEIEELSRFLSSHTITLGGLEQPAMGLNRQFTLRAKGDPHAFNLHGRLYGGFWMTLPEEDREHILINGEEIADLDFTAMFPTLAYIEAGHAPPDVDPYDIAGLPRKSAKAAMSALLSVSKPLGRMPPRLRKAIPKAWNIERLRTAIIDRHPPLEPHLERDLALKLMFTESRILFATLSDLMTSGVPALPIHDGIMVPQSKADLALGAMEQASRVICGMTIKAVRKV